MHVFSERTLEEELSIDEHAEPERDLLEAVLHDHNLASRLARVPGGWRTLSKNELDTLEISRRQKKTIVALQALVAHGYPALPRLPLRSSADVGRVYGERLGGLVYEVMLAVALDGRNNFVAEVPIASGGAHGLSVTARDVLRPLVRIGASAFVLVHNHPSGSPTPSTEDITMTHAVAACADVVGLPLVDHVIVGARGGGYCSLLDLGLIDHEMEKPHAEHEATSAE